MYKFILGIALCLFPLCFAAEVGEPEALYLTWSGDPRTTMLVSWITLGQECNGSIVNYQKIGDHKWLQAGGTAIPIPEGFDEYFLHQVEITNLHPNTDYRFRAGCEAKVYTFRTMPKNHTQPIRFVVGGDIYHDSIEAMEETTRHAALYSPSFALLGGDLAYSADKDTRRPDDFKRYLTFLKMWKQTMITQRGHMVPILATTSNEDTKGRYNRTKADAPIFYTLFRRGGQEEAYRVVDFGSYMSIWLLDSGHTNPIAGKQTDWLRATMSERRNVPLKYAIYHVPSYPSTRKKNEEVSSLMRNNWLPIFEEFGVKVGFEHHDHAYKRTFKIKNGKKNESGPFYMGDGGWGVSNPRKPMDPSQEWYLVKTAQKRHFIVATVRDKIQTYQAVDHMGVVFDEVREESE